MSDDTRERSRHAARDASAPPNGSDGNQTMFQPDGHLNAEMVSAWLDTPDDFTAEDRLAIEAHLAGCAQCSQVAAELTAIVRAFQQLPLTETPRSFALTPEMAGLVRTPTLPASRLEEPAHPHERQIARESGRPVIGYEPVAWYERWMGTLRWATAVAALLFVFVFSVDLLGNVDTSGDDDDMAVETDQPFMTGAAPESTEAAGEAVPEEESADDSARSSVETPNPAAAAGEEEDAAGGSSAATEASGGGSSAEPQPTTAISEEEEEEEAPPAQGGDESASEEPETMMSIPTADEDAQQDAAPEESQTIASYNAEQAASEDGESDVLHILELALIIAIAWFLVAMIALPRLRRPGT